MFDILYNIGWRLLRLIFFFLNVFVACKFESKWKSFSRKLTRKKGK